MFLLYFYLIYLIIFYLIFIRSLNNEMFSDICWTTSMYLESVALFPQLYMFQKQASDEGGIVEVKLFFIFQIFE